VNVRDLKMAFYQSKYVEGSDMGMHISNLQSIYGQLEIAGETLADKDLVDAYLMSLPRGNNQWATLRTAMEQSYTAQGKDLTSAYVEQQLMEQAARSASSKPLASKDPSAMAASTPRGKKERKKFTGKCWS
ncbi:hypothetical protein HK405_011164, partial [Cladochytrium tenue]